MRHVIFSGSFFDSGVKKFATALPVPDVSNMYFQRRVLQSYWWWLTAVSALTAAEKHLGCLSWVAFLGLGDRPCWTQ